MPSYPSRHRAVFVLFTSFFLVGTATAATRTRVTPERFAKLHAPHGGQTRLERIPLGGGREQTLIVEEFDVLAPGAEIEVFDKDGKPARVKPQPMRQFRGSVEGDPDSIVYLSVKNGKRLDGFVISRQQKFSLFSDHPGRAGSGAPSDDVFVDELTEDDEAELTAGISCDADGGALAGHAKSVLPRSLATTSSDAEVAGLYAWPTSTAVTVLNLAVETDTALYANFSNSATAVETFIRNLIGATSTIYRRDLRTEIRIPYLGIHTTTDPFTVNPGQTGNWDGVSTGWTSMHALLELGDRWHNNAPSSARRSAAMLISGQPQTAGIAWIDVTCRGDFAYQGHWGGAYSYCGGVGLSSADRTVPNPDALANFATPNSGYWPLMQVAHEFGHNVQSNHTHCIALSAADQIAYGRGFVDNCYSGGGSGCYSGPTSRPAEAPSSRGTIMSYCHLLNGGSATRFTFGQANEASHTILDNMRARLDSITPTGLSSITAPGSIAVGATGTASVTNAGLTYTWSIANGTFAGGATTASGASVTFTATATPVTLWATGTNASGCSVSDTTTIAAGTSVAAPANVTATATSATSVTVTWSTVAGATSYNVYRRAAGGAFTLVGPSISGASFVDAVPAGGAYLYRVRAVSGAESPDSNSDLATAVVFTDVTLTAGLTPMKSAHVSELRTAVNAVRALAGQALTPFTDASLAGLTCRRVHIIELRDALTAARAALGLPAATFGEAITVGATPPRVTHVNELRAGVR